MVRADARPVAKRIRHDSAARFFQDIHGRIEVAHHDLFERGVVVCADR